MDEMTDEEVLYHYEMAVVALTQCCVSDVLAAQRAKHKRSAAVLARMGPPPGWKLLPVEPTMKMREAFHVANERYENCLGDSAPDDQWTAMLDAAPAAPRSPAEGAS